MGGRPSTEGVPEGQHFIRSDTGPTSSPDKSKVTKTKGSAAPPEDLAHTHISVVALIGSLQLSRVCEDALDSIRQLAPCTRSNFKGWCRRWKKDHKRLKGV